MKDICAGKVMRWIRRGAYPSVMSCLIFSFILSKVSANLWQFEVCSIFLHPVRNWMSHMLTAWQDWCKVKSIRAHFTTNFLFQIGIKSAFSSATYRIYHEKQACHMINTTAGIHFVRYRCRVICVYDGPQWFSVPITRIIYDVKGDANGAFLLKCAALMILATTSEKVPSFRSGGKKNPSIRGHIGIIMLEAALPVRYHRLGARWNTHPLHATHNLLFAMRRRFFVLTRFPGSVANFANAELYNVREYIYYRKHRESHKHKHA